MVRVDTTGPWSSTAGSLYAGPSVSLSFDEGSVEKWFGLIGEILAGIRKGIRLPIRGGEPAQQMFARKHKVQMCAPDPRLHP